MFVAHFYLQRAQADADVYGDYFCRPFRAQYGAIAGERCAHGSHRRSLSVDFRRDSDGVFLIGANLGADTHWIWPAILLALTGVGSAFFNTPSQAVMIGALPKEHWGTAIGIINGIFGLGHMLGISLSGIFLTLAFRYYSGIPGTTPNPGDTQVFVASINVTYVFALVISIIPLLTSLKMKKSV